MSCFSFTFQYIDHLVGDRDPDPFPVQFSPLLLSWFHCFKFYCSARAEGFEPSSSVLETDLLAITISPHFILSFFFLSWCPVELNHDPRDFTPVHFYPFCQSTICL